jgi:NADPH-dependent ferric siderophore reductase
VTTPIRARRPPPPFRRARVVATTSRTPRLQRVTVQGPELVGLEPGGPAASIRMLLPHDGELVLPQWNGNEFLEADGSRPHLRTLTPLRVDRERGEVDVDIVLHGSGPMATWAASAAVGDPVAISGTGRGYTIDADAPLLLGGDESALPALSTILDALPPDASARALVEIGDPEAELDLRVPDEVTVTWHVLPGGSPPGDALVEAVVSTSVAPDARVWVAGEAASVQRIRRHLFETLGLPRARCAVRGYWKHGRAGGDDAAP